MTPTPTHTAVQPLPCPFCGGTSVSVRAASTFRWRQALCDDCGAQAGEARANTLAEDREQAEREARNRALEEWNRRASLPQGEQPADVAKAYWSMKASQDVQLPGVIEQLAKQWDGRMFGEIDIGKAIRIDGRRFLKDSVAAPVQPPGATLSPCAASTAITPAIADALAKARLFVLCALRREGCRFTYHDQPEHWGERLLESIEKASSQVDRGESSSEGGES